MKFTPLIICLLSSPFLFTHCVQSTGQTNDHPATTPEFNDHWFDGRGELNSYKVVQNRYGELRDAEQVLVFVTEDFSKSKQVKLDYPDRAGKDRMPVLKLNTVRRFHTGIYDYSVTQSVFVPLNGAPASKLTTSVQDWCGHVFTQMNRTAGGYRLREFSYFEQEGDTDRNLPDALVEDAIWAMIRLNPQKLPQGQQKIIPATLHSRFLHVPLEVRTATLTLNKVENGMEYVVDYQDWGRKLVIEFEAAFPHRITGWEETQSGDLLSSGTLQRSFRSAYWNKNDNDDLPLRDSLQWHF